MNNPIVIFFSREHNEGNPPQISYKQSYKLLSDFAKMRNIDLRFVVGIDNFTKGIYSSYWKFSGDDLVEVKDTFRAKIVYVRNRISPTPFKNRINNEYLENICRDKFLTSETFPAFSKKTVLISPHDLSSLKDLKTDLIVLKPRYGANGENVQVLTKGQITPGHIRGANFIAQEFIDSSEGIEGLLTQRHELRIFVFNGEIKAAYLRVPAPNSYLANISQGATEKLIELTKIPHSTYKLQQEVDKLFANINPRLYSLDIMYERKSPWIVELNDTPGMPDIRVQPFTNDYLNLLLDFLNS